MNQLATTDAKLVEQRANTIYERIAALKVVDQESYQLAADIVKEAKRVANAIEERFEEAIAAANSAHKEAIKIRNEAMAKFDEAESLAKQKMIAYVEAADERPEAEGISVIDKWLVEVVDEKKLPREYMQADIKKIQGMATALKSELRIPGVKVYCTKQLVVRVGK